MIGPTLIGRHKMTDEPSVKLTRILYLLAITFCFSTLGHSSELEKIEQWGVYELNQQGTSTGNPYLDVTFEAEFEHDSHAVTVPGFSLCAIMAIAHPYNQAMGSQQKPSYHL